MRRTPPSTTPPSHGLSERPAPSSSDSPQRSTIPPSSPDRLALRGAEILAQKCLVVQPGEVVHALTFRAEEVFALVAQAIDRAGGRVVRIALDALPEGRASLDAELASALAGATASVLLAGEGLPTNVSRAVVTATQRARTRHLHVVHADPRIFGQSICADPALLTLINQRLLALIEPPAQLSVQSRAGTSLEITLSPHYPRLAASGRPIAAKPDNLPAGKVYVHPAQLAGVMVVDRSIIGEGIDSSTTDLRRTPVRFSFVQGRVTSIAGPIPICARIERYLASHADAGRVGMIVLPTNYMVRSEIGLEIQDALLPGVNVNLGFSLSEQTRAPFDVPMQLRLRARRLSVARDRTAIVTEGRLEPALVEGIDPFR